MSAHPHIDFGYPWWLSYGHVPIIAGSVLLLVIGYLRRWSRWAMILACVLAVWSTAAFAVQRFVLNINDVPDLPTQRFLQSGTGRVLDMGAGTGRSSIMVLAARPGTTLVAVDLFGESFRQHFGPSPRPEEKLKANLQVAGVNDRAAIQMADIRKLPFEPGEFDAVVSAYAIDHLNRKGIQDSLAEAARVIKPQGELLLMVIASEPWGTFAFGPLLKHGGTRGAPWWHARVQEAGFQVVEEGTYPLTLYLLARRS